MLCSQTDAHPNLNREVRHSPTWHSSESESALERFEPVAVAMLWSDGRGILFAPVAARRQKVFKRGKRSSFRVLFGQAKRTLKEKNHKDTFLLSYFSVTKSTKKELLLSFYNLKENKSKFVPTFSTRRACAF